MNRKIQAAQEMGWTGLTVILTALVVWITPLTVTGSDEQKVIVGIVLAVIKGLQWFVTGRSV